MLRVVEMRSWKNQPRNQKKIWAKRNSKLESLLEEALTKMFLVPSGIIYDIT